LEEVDDLLVGDVDYGRTFVEKSVACTGGASRLVLA
jgi:hypothetical protein